MLHHLKEQCYHLKHSYESTSLPNIEHDNSPLISKVENERDFPYFPGSKVLQKIHNTTLYSRLFSLFIKFSLA